MVKRDKNAHQSNHYKATHSSGGKANKKSGGKAKKGNKSINKFLGIGKPGPHLLKHKQQQSLRKASAKESPRQQQGQGQRQGQQGQGQGQGRQNQQKQQSPQKQKQKQPQKKTLSPKAKRAALLQARREHREAKNKEKSYHPDVHTNNSNYGDYTNNKNFYDHMANDDASTSLGAAPKQPQHRHHLRDPIAHAGVIDVDEYEADLAYVYRDHSSHQSTPIDTDGGTSSAMSTAASTPEPSALSTLTPAELQHRLERKKKKKVERRKQRKQEKAREKAEKKADVQEARAGKGRPGKEIGDNSYLSPVLRPIDADSTFIYGDAPIGIQKKVPESPAKDTKKSGDGEDALRNGADFIGFDFSDGETEQEPLAPVTLPVAVQPHGEKRKRDVDDGSDAEGSTGPPPGCPWMGHRQYSKMPSVPLMLTQELKDFVEYISPTREEHQVRKYAFRRIKDAVQLLWPDATLEIFGSFPTQLYLPSSDLDIVVLRRKEFVKNDLYRLASHLRECKVAEDFTVIAKARVPIVKCRETISGLPIDISFNITNGLESAKIVKSYMEEVPALRPMTMLIKHFLMIKGYNEVFNGGIGSYTTMIMILSFLQMHPQIQTGMINAEENLGVLLIEFFELYGLCYNYAKVGLSVMGGGAYFVKTGQPQFRGGRPELLLSSIDPNDVENDTARGSYQLSKIREVFVGAYGSLTSSMQERQRTLFGGGGQRQDRSKHFRFDEHNRVPADSVEKSSGVHHGTQVSLIKEVMSVPHAVLHHRRHVESVFYEGSYQDIFSDPHGLLGLDQTERRPY